MFYVGQKVVCVVNWKHHNGFHGGFGSEILPQRDVVYTVREIVVYPDGEAGLRLMEIRNYANPYSYGPGECSFAVRYFRPVTDISDLQSIVAEVTRGKPRAIEPDQFDKQKAAEQ